MICWQGAVHSGAWEPVCALAEKLNVLVGSTINAKGIFPETHPLSLGVIGARGGREWANRCVTGADLILFVGSRTDSAGTNGWTVPNAESKVAMIQIDVSEHELGNNYDVLPLLGDARETLSAILDALPASVDSEARIEWVAEAKKTREEHEAKLDEFEKNLGDKITPFSVARLLERTMPDDAFFAIDPGVSAVYPAAFMRLKAAGRRTAYNFAMGALGYAIPAAIGARAGIENSRRVVGLVGDGSFGFTAGELAFLLDDCAKAPGPKLIALPVAAEDEELPPPPGGTITRNRPACRTSTGATACRSVPSRR